MQKCVHSIRNFLTDHDGLYNEDMTVTFDSFGASSLNIFVICYTKTTDYLEFLRLKEEINFALLNIMSEYGVSAAFPSTSVYFETPLTTNSVPSTKNT
jgi:MscS family membrane protein